MVKREHYGEHGGMVLREFKGDGKKYIVGAVLTWDDVKLWPLANRKALHSEGRVDWFAPQNEENEPRKATPENKIAKPKEAPVKPKRVPRRTTR